MRSSPEIDIINDWKMVTIFIGANDLCSASCLNPVSWSPSAHAKKLARAIDYLQKHLPRTIVNLVPVLGKFGNNYIQRSMNILAIKNRLGIFVLSWVNQHVLLVRAYCSCNYCSYSGVWVGLVPASLREWEGCNVVWGFQMCRCRSACCGR